MRLVSVIYQGLYPFDLMFPLAEQAVANHPNDLREGDILVVWGGADIHPSLYNKGRSRHSWAATDGPSPRDELEWALMNAAKNMRIPIIGVCRGAQMLCALAGGSLFQHVNNHGGSYHNAVGEKEYQVNSIHHQMMDIKNTDGITIMKAAPKRSDVYWDVDEHGDVLVDIEEEPEFVLFPSVRGYAIQWHPEMMGVESAASQHVYEVLKSERI